MTSVIEGTPTPFRRLSAVVIALCAVLVVCLLTTAVARADGDPGSDVLLDQNLFFGADAGLSSGQQTQLGNLLNATAKAGAPIRVAIISDADDLGTVTQLWQKPQEYADYLGQELSLAYPGRLLVVMPGGYGVSWHANRTGEQRLADLMAHYRPSSTSAAGYVSATSAAVDLIENKAGIGSAVLARDDKSGSVNTEQAALRWREPELATTALAGTGGGDSGSTTVLLVLVVLVLIALTAGYVLLSRKRGRAVKSLNLVVASLLGAAVVAALIVSQSKPSSADAASGRSLATNPDLDPGTTLTGQMAPNFTLTDESGHQVRLSQYRGKVVVLSFVDAECQTICPLTTQAMLDAKAALGKAGKNVQLLGVNANWKSLQVDDVLRYTELHGMLGRWHFLTSSSLSQLERVWTAYHVNEKALDHGSDNDIEHIAATYVIGPDGRERDLFTTSSSYAAIDQMGERIAQDAAKLLPGHPRVNMSESYAQIHGVAPTRHVALSRLGGGNVAMGPGHPRLYLFFATWDAQTTPIAGELSGLMNEYSKAAKLDGLPGVTAIDEASVEPSPKALPLFISSLPAKLRYPVAIDATGRIADGYDVEGEPWFVLVNSAGHIVWYQEVYTSGWPKLGNLEQQVRSALRTNGLAAPTSGTVSQELAGSPKSLAALHKQSSQLLPGGLRAFDARIRQLRGYTIVLNVWGSWCSACQKEYPLFAKASAEYGKRIAFLGADTLDSDSAARQYLSQHHLSYPSYAVPYSSFSKMVAGGLTGLPDTIYISPKGKIENFHQGVYLSQGELDHDIQDAALGG